MNSGLLFANYVFAYKTAVFKNCLSILFRIPQKRKERESKNRYFSVSDRYLPVVSKAFEKVACEQALCLGKK